MKIIKFSTKFLRNQKKLIKNNKLLAVKIVECLRKLSIDPFDSSLNTHNVQSAEFGFSKASRVSGDLRIIWNYETNDKIVILALDIGGHSGSNAVYK